jgi:hypothetical protein
MQIAILRADMATREYYSKIFIFVSIQIAILRADMTTREYYSKIVIFVSNADSDT